MSQLLVCTMNLPEFAVSGSLIADCPQPEHCAGMVESLKILKSVGSRLPVSVVCGPRSFATSAVVVCRPRGGLGSAASNLIWRSRAAFCAAVGTNGLVLVAAPTKRPADTWPVLTAALLVPAGTVLAASPDVLTNPATTQATLPPAPN